MPIGSGAAPARRVTLVLSGGGAKTAAHLGVWRALHEVGLRPTHLVAVSMGAVVAAALAAGATPDELLARLVDVGRGSVLPDPDAPAAGLAARSLFRADGLRHGIEAVLSPRRFDELAIPLAVPVVDLDSGASVLYGAGGRDAPLVDVLCATCALPVYFPPVPLDGRRTGDGGLRGALPLEAAASVPADLVIAVDVGPGLEPEPADAAPAPPLPPLLRAHDDAVGALMAAVTAAQLALWRAEPARPPLVYVRPPVERNATFRTDRLAHYEAAGYAAGYQAARDALNSAA
jgi:NTE family protein